MNCPYQVIRPIRLSCESESLKARAGTGLDQNQIATTPWYPGRSDAVVDQARQNFFPKVPL